MPSNKAGVGRVRVIDGDHVRIVSGKSLSAVQSSITCNGGLPRPRPAPDPVEK